MSEPPKKRTKISSPGDATDQVAASLRSKPARRGKRAVATTPAPYAGKTRSQTLHERWFFKLSAEIRNIIYRYALNFDGVKNWSANELMPIGNSTARRSTASMRCPILTTPTVLLLNKRIFDEAAWVLDRIPIVFCLSGAEHCKELTHFISESLLIRLPSIEIVITDPVPGRCVGFEALTSNLTYLGNWMHEFADLFSKKHDVKKFKLVWEETTAAKHLNICYLEGNDMCYVGDLVRAVVSPLLYARGFECVEFVGAADVFAQELDLHQTMKLV